MERRPPFQRADQEGPAQLTAVRPVACLNRTYCRRADRGLRRVCSTIAEKQLAVRCHVASNATGSSSNRRGSRRIRVGRDPAGVPSKFRFSAADDKVFGNSALYNRASWPMPISSSSAKDITRTS